MSDDVPPDALLAAWTDVFPLSSGLAHRVGRQTGPGASTELVDAIAADYVRELSGRLPSGCRITVSGDLFGPHEFDGSGQDVLFMAVFTTDLDAIVHRHAPPDPKPAN